MNYEQMVEVTWIDAILEEGHLPDEAVQELKPLQRRNVGYLLYEDKEMVTITFGVIENCYKKLTACDLAFAIPRCMIKNIKHLKES